MAAFGGRDRSKVWTSIRKAFVASEVWRGLHGPSDEGILG